MSDRFDLAIVGAGFSGSLLAAVARRLGLSVVLLEKGAHPRFAIGESSSPLANLLLEEICDRYGLDRIKPLTAWGTWRRAYPEVNCGLKRGFTFYAHVPGQPFGADSQRGDQLLVAASPCDEVADTHWYRADFDRFLAEEAAREGAEYLDRTEIEHAAFNPGSTELATVRLGRRLTLRARFVVDASGPRGFLHRALGLPEAAFPDLPATEGLYTHFSGVRRIGEMGILPGTEEPPYPPDDAALHHVFPGGWVWVLRFADGTTSAGVAAVPGLARDLVFEDGEAAWQRLLSRLPTVREQFANARAVQPFVHARRLPFRSGVVAGPGWALLPSAAAFVDPLLSTGFPLTLLGIQRLARLFEAGLPGPDLEAGLDDYARATLADADAAALLVSALYTFFDDFPVFAALTHLYFAAASYTEAVTRLNRSAPRRSFLLREDPAFGPGFFRLCRAAIAAARQGGFDPEERDGWLGELRRTVAGRDVAGLGRAERRNWHPVDPRDLLEGAGKLGASRGDVEALLETWFPANPRVPVE
ncbi:MAG TPA: FAD-dependent oxidoreductase [Thermoanaerobaculia bacterium]|nr:FAD-dependent oxidoreductase [Thermoanaerobaculia bacterium]